MGDIFRPLCACKGKRWQRKNGEDKWCSAGHHRSFYRPSLPLPTGTGVLWKPRRLGTFLYPWNDAGNHGVFIFCFTRYLQFSQDQVLRSSFIRYDLFTTICCFKRISEHDDRFSGYTSTGSLFFDVRSTCPFISIHVVVYKKQKILQRRLLREIQVNKIDDISYHHNCTFDPGYRSAGECGYC